MIPVAEALQAIFALVEPLGTDTVPLTAATGRILAAPVAARRDQPPFATSVMDGYAVRAEDVRPGATLAVVSEAAAGHATAARVGAGEAIRIFTGAPVPSGASRVVIQEDVIRDGEWITFRDRLDEKPYIRPAGADFRLGDTLSAPRRLTPAEVSLIAAMNHADVPVMRRPVVAILSTGDELVSPGETPGPDQIVASNGYGLHAMLAEAGALPRLLPIARDSRASLEAAFDLAGDADLLVTIGGASVGDHDLVGQVAADRGMELSFYKVAMRPGKPLMAGRMGGRPMIGLPGNPVSALVCGKVFLVPAIRKMLGLGAAPSPRSRAVLAAPVAANGPREHYMRATVEDGRIAASASQDSGLLKILATANALLIRPPHDPARAAGEIVDYLPL